jgi:hypothetical protein
MRRSAMAVAAVAALGGSMIGCGWTPPPESVPTFRVDMLASEVTVQGEAANLDAALQFRAQIAGALNDMVADRDDFDSESPPARFRASVSYDGSIWPTAACGLGILIMFGCPVASLSRTVDLTLEIDGEIYEGHGEASGAASFYYNNMGQSTTGSAVEEALKDALGKRGKPIARAADGGAL